MNSYYVSKLDSEFMNSCGNRPEGYEFHASHDSTGEYHITLIRTTIIQRTLTAVPSLKADTKHFQRLLTVAAEMTKEMKEQA